MAEEILASVQVRRDSKANWENVNPILLNGEAAYEQDTDMFKIGDGVKRYSDLPYHNKVGPQGEPGLTPQISMNVSTGNPGTSASVSVTGTAENPVINLTVPRGDTGKTGSIGPKGDTGSSGVYIGTSQPTDSNINVWIDSDGEPTEVIDDLAREEISSLKNDLVEQKVTLGVTSNSKVKSDFFNFILGGMYSTTGEISLSTKYAYSDIKPIGKGSIIIVPNIGIAYVIGIATYDKNKSFIKRLPNVSYATGGEIVLDFDVEYVAFNFGVAGSLGRNIEESDLEKFEIKVINNNSVYGLIDETYDNALKYGFVNDGTTDNSTAFANYIAKNTDGFRLFFPGGIYVFNESIVIDSINNFVIDGEGTLKLANNVYTDSASEEIYFLRVMNCENITIKNVTIDGNKTNNPIYYYGTSADTLTVDSCKQINIENVKVADAIDSGIFVTNSSGVHIAKCRVMGNRVAVNNITFSISGTTLTVNGTFESNAKGKYIWLTSGAFCIYGVITSVQNDSVTCSVINTYGQQSKNSGSIFVFNCDAGIYLNNCINSDGSHIEDNYVYAFSMGIHCNRGCSNLKITNNNILNCVVGMDLTTYDTTDGIAYINPSKNIITENQFTVDAVGVACKIAEYTIISNNYVKSNLRGIELSGCNSVIASGNMLVGSALSADSYAGIVLSKGQKDGVIYKTDYAAINGNILIKWYNGIRKNIEATNIVISDGNGFREITHENISDGDIE